MSLKPNNDGAQAASQPNSGDAAASWPVLARLPWVGSPRPERTSPAPPLASSERPAPPLPAQVSKPSLRIAETSTAAYDIPETAEPAPRRELSHRRTYIDEPHASVRAYDWPAATDAAIAIESAARDASTRRTHHRVDQASRKASTTSTAQPTSSIAAKSKDAPSKRESLAGRVFQLHASLAPHAGIALTLALVASAAALWWLTIGQPGEATGYDNALDAPSSWSGDPAGDPNGAKIEPGDAAPIQGYTMPFNWRANPAYEGHAPGPGSSPYVASAIGGAMPACDGSTGRNVPAAAGINNSGTPSNQLMSAPPLPTLPGSAAVTSNLAGNGAKPQHPITPTPQTLPYPTTSFAAIGVAPSQQTAAPSVADRTDGSASPPR